MHKIAKKLHIGNRLQSRYVECTCAHEYNGLGI